jgi:Tfp pilus assembly protein PilV
MSRPAPRSRGRERGAILLEVLVAMTVLVVGISVVARGLRLGILASSLSESQTVAARLAADKLVEIETSDLARLVDDADDFGEEYPGFRWETRVRDGEAADLRELELTIFWTRRNVERELTLVRLLFVGESGEGL